MSIYIPPPEWTQEKAQERSELLLRELGFSGRMLGLRYLSASIAMTAIAPDKILFVTKELYPDVAKQYRSTPSKVERAIRHSIHRFWERGGREALDRVTKIHLTQRPTNSELIDLLANYIRRNS